MDYTLNEEGGGDSVGQNGGDDNVMGERRKKEETL